MLLLFVGMKAVFQKISSFIMALVVMFSTMSFSINKHYCMDHLVDVSVIFPADSCGMDMMATPSTEGEQFDATPCCSEEHIAIEGQDEINTADSLSVEISKTFVTAFAYTFNALYVEEFTERPEYEDYSPPLITKDLPVFYETYLI
ncbi:hypothetical protein E7Z59_11910 [Robertkochia marina]|uniref:Uncharacterized protein n=1 Tax=Robertkochia marina TaxID=1227945 RepID=A0A4S3LY44_9FLAO|nr:hypothetical protein [Robertkochia marina]THD66500.1 hypothetical protein E7Z59_11910 [Robertkochia marina]TRZ45661.1 hypothetical protein D3A96_06725 [Robertkochia marina]